MLESVDERVEEKREGDEGMEDHEERAEEERHRRRAIRSAAAVRGGKALGAFPRALPVAPPWPHVLNASAPRPKVEGNQGKRRKVPHPSTEGRGKPRETQKNAAPLDLR